VDAIAVFIDPDGFAVAAAKVAEKGRCQQAGQKGVACHGPYLMFRVGWGIDRARLSGRPDAAVHFVASFCGSPVQQRQNVHLVPARIPSPKEGVALRRERQLMALFPVHHHTQGLDIL